MLYNVLIQQPPKEVYNQKGSIIDHRSFFLKIKDVTVSAPDDETALDRAKRRYPQFIGRLAVQPSLN